MGFLDSIGTLLGGFNDVKQIDSTGFDFREKRRQEELARQQQQQEWEQSNAEFQRQQEEADIAGLAEASLAPGATPESVESGLKPDVQGARRKFMLDRATGRSAQSKSSLASQKANTDWMLKQMGGDQRLEQIDAAGGEAQDLVRLRAEVEAGRKLSPRDQAMLDSAEKRAAARGGGSGGGGRPQLRQVKDENGNTVWRWLSPGEGAPAPATAIERQAAGMADTIKGNVAEMGQLAPDVPSGRILGNLSKASQWALGPHGKAGEFDFDANAVIDTVYVKSGKQINQTEMAILRNMIPNRGKGNLEEQVRLFSDYANSLLQKYGSPAKSGGGADPLEGRTATGPGGQKLVRRGGKWVPVQ